MVGSPSVREPREPHQSNTFLLNSTLDTTAGRRSCSRAPPLPHCTALWWHGSLVRWLAAQFGGTRLEKPPTEMRYHAVEIRCRRTVNRIPCVSSRRYPPTRVAHAALWRSAMGQPCRRSLGHVLQRWPKGRVSKCSKLKDAVR